jgi:hypothetical protein
MAKKRYIDTKFWSDNYITELDILERYLFLYLISNEHTGLCGIYEIPLRVMAFESGLDTDMLSKILGRFEVDGKILYRNGWVAIKNFIKNQVSNPSVNEGITRELESVPVELKEYINTVSIQSVPTLGTGKLSLVKLSKVKYSNEIVKILSIFEKKNPAIKRMYGNKTQRDAAERLISQFGIDKVSGRAEFALSILGLPYAPRVTTPYLLETKWADIEAFYHEQKGKQQKGGVIL